MPEEREIVLVRATDRVAAPDLQTAAALNEWRFIHAPTLDDVEQAIVRNRVRVVLLQIGADLGDEICDRVALLKAGSRLTQWVALLRGAELTPRVAAFIAQNCFDYVTMPVELALLRAVVGHAYGMSRLLEHSSPNSDPITVEAEMVGSSPPMLRVFSDIRKVAASDAPVFIWGESGTGKELTARAVHERSRRSAGPFVAVNCGAIPPTLIHSELFGYERGAFTGATQRKAGLIESAEGGTIFLDEIGDLSAELQGNLLRFLQESTIQRLGSTQSVTVDVRVIAATHVDLEEAVRRGVFRQDLYYRLNVLRLHMPALRERAEDIEVLARYFLAVFAKDSGKAIRGFTDQALEAMRNYHWPGNVRELINRIRRAIVMCDGHWMAPKDLELAGRGAMHYSVVRLDAARERAERDAVLHALRACSNCVAEAARALGVSRVTLYRLLDRHGLSPGTRNSPVEPAGTRHPDDDRSGPERVAADLPPPRRSGRAFSPSAR